MLRVPKMTQSDLKRYQQIYENVQSYELTEQFIINLARTQFGLEQQDALSVAQTIFSKNSNQKQIVLRCIQCIQNGVPLSQVDIYNVNLPEKIERKKQANYGPDQPRDLKEAHDFNKANEELDELASQFLKNSKQDYSGLLHSVANLQQKLESFSISDSDSEQDDFEVIHDQTSKHPQYEKEFLPYQQFRSVSVRPFQWIKEGYLYGGYYQCRIVSIMKDGESGTKSIEVFRRFTDFKILQSYFTQLSMNEGVILPMLSDEDFKIGSILQSLKTNKNFLYLEERREVFEKYVNDLTRHPELFQNAILFEFLVNQGKFDELLKNLSQQQKNALLFERDLPFFHYFSSSPNIHTKYYEIFKITQNKFTILQAKYQGLNNLITQVNKFYSTNMIENHAQFNSSQVIAMALQSFTRVSVQYQRELHYRQPIKSKLSELEKILKNIFKTIDNLKYQIQLWNYKLNKTEKDPKFFTAQEISSIQLGEQELCNSILKLNQSLDIIIQAYPDYLKNCLNIFTTNLLEAMDYNQL